jgi:hypothetical protein
MNGDYPPDCPLVVQNLNKEYTGGKMAVRDVTFSIQVLA